MDLFYCIVENNIDPDKTGKVQIRIIGKHTENRSDSSDISYIPTANLPWAECLSSVTSSNISGICDFGVPENGSIGLCSFIDKEEQRPIFLGTIARSLTELPDFTQGFSDPNQVHPKNDLVGESQISRLARNENISDTIIQDKIDNVETSVDCNGVSWDEPETQYDVEYPNNRVIETSAGHVIEIDSSSGAERIHIYHKSGTFDEYHPNGDKVERVEGDKYEVFINDNNILVKGDKNIRIEGSANIEISEDESKQVDGTSTVNIDGDVEINSTGGTMTITGNGNVFLQSSGSGLIEISNSSKNLYDILDGVLDILISLQTFGSPTNHSIDVGQSATLSGLKTDLGLLMQ